MKFKNSNSDTLSPKNLIKSAIFAFGLVISASAVASEEDVQVAAFDDKSTMVTEKHSYQVDEEIGSTDVSEFDNAIGAFSREDGAMMGAYGDGEYAE